MGILEITAGQECFPQHCNGFILGGDKDINGTSWNRWLCVTFDRFPYREIKKKCRDSPKEFCAEKHPGKKESVQVKGLCISPVEIIRSDQHCKHSD
jgi:hypothetical protein